MKFSFTKKTMLIPMLTLMSTYFTINLFPSECAANSGA